jgi:Tfp pilus assembly protein PilF
VFDARASKLAPNDTAGWLKLAEWASQNGLPMNAHDAYEKALASAPDNAEARQALGYVQLNGKWLTEDEAYQAQGYVKYQGEWMTPAQAQVEQTNSEQDKARREAEHRAQDAEIAAQQADQRAEEAEKRAKKAEEDAQQYAAPVYWGGYGYGVTTWPVGTSPTLIRNTPSNTIPRSGK